MLSRMLMTPGQLEWSATDDGRCMTVSLRGELDLAAKDETEAGLRQVLQRDPAVMVIDLREVTFMDCCGMSTLIEAHRFRRTRGRPLYFVRGPLGAHRVLALTGVDDLLVMVDDPEQIPGI